MKLRAQLTALWVEPPQQKTEADTDQSLGPGHTAGKRLVFALLTMLDFLQTALLQAFAQLVRGGPADRGTKASSPP